MFNALRSQLARLISPVRNAMSLPAQFMRYGNNNRMLSNWSEVMISDKEMYTGYAYAAIRNRAFAVSRVASEQVTTDSKQADLVHPYCELIWNSKTFSEFAFWSEISTFLDLEGVYYLMAIRANDSNRKAGQYSNIKEFKLLNPYNIRRVLDEKNLEVQGYVETRKGFVREIPKEMIIEIRELNPFSEDEPFAMVDAAKESQFTLKTSSDYTRNVIKNNINAPGILSTDVILQDQEFANFKNRVTQHTKGEPLFGNGSGAITWESMSQDLSKAALKDTSEINRDQLISVTGMSKTMLGIEQSGVTRDTARVQKDLMVESQVLPRIQLIIDALNLDYRNKYPKEYAATEAYIEVGNPQETDHSADLTESQVQKADFELYQSMLGAGYTPKKASKFIAGEIDVDGLGMPKKVEPAVVASDAAPADAAPTNALKKKENKLEVEKESEIEHQQALLKNSVIHIEKQLVTAAINRVDKNAYEDESDVVSKKEKKHFIEEMALVLATFYTLVFQKQGPETMAERIARFGLVGAFKIDRQAASYIKQVSAKVAESHIQTVTKEILQTAREAALEGLSQSEIVNRIKQVYANDISTKRAEVVARTETNRAFTQAQYDADRQFIAQNELEGKAYKRWKTRSANPCPFCESLEAEGLIPFDINFRDLGEEVVVGTGKDKKVLNISFESLEAGNAHPNCSCIYELVIK